MAAHCILAPHLTLTSGTEFGRPQGVRRVSGDSTPPPGQPRNHFLDRVERLGNALPDPVLIFVALIALLLAMSAAGAAAGWSAVNPVTGDTLSVKSLLAEQSLQLIIAEIPRTYTGFAPLGLVLTILLGAAWRTVAACSPRLCAPPSGPCPGAP